MQNSELSQTYKEYLLILKECSPYDFSEYSDNSINRRIQKIMHDNNLSMHDLIHKTRTDAEFVEQLVEAITVNTTELFRDPQEWSQLRQKILPTFKKNPKINIWHAGCSTGQEVYSLVILLDYLNLLDKADIYATDISKKAIEQASCGTYRYSFNYEKYFANFQKAFEKKEMPDFKKYFSVNEPMDTLSVKPEFLGKVKYVKHDLVNEELPFYNKFDIVFCRNVLIYFNGSLQTKIVQRFHDNLFPGGTMVLGLHETLNGFFKTKFAKTGPVYTRTNTFHFKY